MLFKKQRQRTQQNYSPRDCMPPPSQKESVALYKIQAERNRRYAGEHRRQSRCRKCRHHGANALPVSIRSRNHHKGREYFARAKRKNQKQCPKARLVRQPADFFLRPNRLRSNAFSPAPISKRAIREKSTLLQTQETPISLCPRAQRREKKPPPHPHQMRFPSPQPRLMKANAPCRRQPQTQESSEDLTRATFQSRQTASSAPDSPPYAPHQTPPQSPPKPIFRRYLPYHNLFAKCAQ